MAVDVSPARVRAAIRRMPPRRLPQLQPALRADLLWGAATAFLSLLVGMWALDAWGHVRTDVPAYYAQTVPSRFSFDLNFTLLIVQAVAETGSYQSHPRVGAPFGLEFYDFPQGTENLHWLIIRLIAVVAETPGAITNTFFMLTFPLVAASAFAVFRALAVSRVMALVVAVLFAVLPYHFVRGEYHLLLSNYMAVPLGCLLVTAVLRGDGVFRRSGRRRRLGGHWFTVRTVGVVVVCAVIGAAGSYYAALTMMLLGLGGLVATLVHRRRGPLGTALVLCAAILASTLANLGPTLAYWQDNGRNEITAVRAAADAEVFSLKFAQLVLPSSLHRIDAVGAFGARYATEQTLADEGTAALGIVGSLGFLWLLVFTLMATGGGRLRLPHAETHRAAALGAVLALAIGTTGGISALVSWYVSPQLRAYNRASVFIAFFALLAVALLLDAAATRMRDRGVRGPLLAMGAGILLIVGVLDQTSPKLTPDYARAEQRWASLEFFGKQVEESLPPGADVFQLPIVPFPEFYDLLGPYDHAEGALHTRALRWSFGAMKGRPAYEWQTKLATRPIPEQVRGAAAAGFSALYFDRRGFDPATVGDVEGDIRRTLAGRPVVVDDEQRLVLYDLRPYAARLREKLGSAAVGKLGEETLRAPPPPEAAD